SATLAASPSKSAEPGFCRCRQTTPPHPPSAAWPRHDRYANNVGKLANERVAQAALKAGASTTRIEGGAFLRWPRPQRSRKLEYGAPTLESAPLRQFMPEETQGETLACTEHRFPSQSSRFQSA